MGTNTAGSDPSAFDLLAPFIQEFIWKHGWSEMRSIQIRAAAAAFGTQKHLLLAAGTASGKTEAAFLPILTELYRDPSATIGALYIGPLKALINDQFLRLDLLCLEAGIKVTAWHGDVAASKKHALLKNPSGILQITPEALEGLVLNRSSSLMQLFGDLRWIVIDEVHAFMASDRGGQVICLLDRLSRFALDPTRQPRRAGLSATLGDYDEAAAWLKGSSNRDVEIIAEDGGRTVFLLVDHFLVNADPSQPRALQAGNSDVPGNGNTGTDNNKDNADAADKLVARQGDLFKTAFEATRNKKSLIFTNSRSDAEEMITALRRLAERAHLPDIFHVHHGSIAPALREAAEIAMRDGEGPACTAATVTLELGIDLGQLDRVLQLGPTYTVASFLQRLGRSGRRGQRPEMLFLLRQNEAQANDSVLERISWELLQTVALIQLYAEERWIEPLARPRLPGSLLYHQTMSVVGGAGELSPTQLAERVLTLAPFARVSQDNFRCLLRHLLQIDHLERTEEGGLMLGLAGEKVVRNFRFLATFQDNTEWAVKDASMDIGTVGSPVPVGERFALAGRMWEVVDLIAEQRLMMVKHVRGALKTNFSGGGAGDIHDRVVERMRQVLVEDTVYPYLTARALDRLTASRAVARSAGVTRARLLIAPGDARLYVLPWAGSRQMRTMTLKLGKLDHIKSVRQHNFYIEITLVPAELSALKEELVAASKESWNGGKLVQSLDRIHCERAKYDVFLPEQLLKASFLADQLDVDGAAERVKQLMASYPAS